MDIAADLLHFRNMWAVRVVPPAPTCYIRPLTRIGGEKASMARRKQIYEGKAKVLLGVCRGKQLHDKRETLKKQTMQREIDRAARR